MDTFTRLIWRCNSKTTVFSSVVLRDDNKSTWQHLSRNNLYEWFLRLQEFYTQQKPGLKAGGESIRLGPLSTSGFLSLQSHDNLWVDFALPLTGSLLRSYFLFYFYFYFFFWVFRFFPLPLCLFFSSQINSFNFPAWILSGKHEHLLQRVGKETTLYILFFPFTSASLDNVSESHNQSTTSNEISLIVTIKLRSKTYTFLACKQSLLRSS